MCILTLHDMFFLLAQEPAVRREQGPGPPAVPARDVARPAREPRHRGRPQVGPRPGRGAALVGLRLFRGTGRIFSVARDVQGGPSASGKIDVDIKFKVPSLA